MGGLVLNRAVDIFDGYVVFQPIINGIGGNLVSVQASKISTMLHQSSIIGILPPHANIVELPWKALFKGGESTQKNGNLPKTNFLSRFSSLCKDSTYTYSNVNSWSDFIHIYRRLYT